MSTRPEEAGPAVHMANQALVQPEEETKPAVPATGGHELDALLGKAFEEKNAFQGLYESIRDIFFPVKLPPLELTSTPIPVPDRLAVKRNPWATGISTTFNVGILAILLFVVGKKVIEAPKPPEETTPVDISDFKLMGPKKAIAAGGGGGGGSKDPIPPVKGRLPKLEPKPITPPQVAVLDKPKLAVEPSIDVQKDLKLPDNMSMPNIGVTNSPNVKLASNGPGSGAGMGSGSGGGLGSGTGNGLGPGQGGNTGGGLYRVGGGISAPSVLYAPEAEFSDEARRAKYQGVCLIAVIVDAHGNPVNPRVIRPLGMGLDEKALEAVRKYKFKPALKDGRTPVPVMINIEVNFRLY
ncbi:MAG TPA: TonB family protein [Terracidiphilus sp.]|nr:TonB family protein [Terracidiphilus sp.]